MSSAILSQGRQKGARYRLERIHWPLVIMLTMLAGAGTITLYSVAEGSWEPWAIRHSTRFAAAAVMMIAMGLISIRFWMSLAYPVYFLALVALAAVPFIGAINMGAQRWIEFGGFQFQPSEPMKLGLVMALARYYHGLRAEQVSHILFLIPPLIMIGAPVALVFIQPDLGTALLLAATGVAIMFVAGLSWRIGFLGAMSAGGLGYAAYYFDYIKPYQLERILTFLNPDRDPLGQGYHLSQSKIALGSGGLDGKGYMEGTQSQLQFLPEMQTDFIFTIFGEEFGFIGTTVLLLALTVLGLRGFKIAVQAKDIFGSLLVTGIISLILAQSFLNIGAMIGLAPLSGLPLPFISHGGTSLLVTLAAMGIVLNVSKYQTVRTRA